MSIWLCESPGTGTTYTFQEPYKSGGQVYTWTTVEHVSLSCLSRARVVVKVAEQPRFLQERAAAGLRGAAVDLGAVPRLAPRPRPRPWPVSGAAGWAGLAAWSGEPAGDGDGDWERLGGRGLLERERDDLSSIFCNVMMNVIIYSNAAVTERQYINDRCLIL